MKITVLFFASCRDQCGTDRLELEIDDGLDTTQLGARLLEMYPSLSNGIRELSLAVNKKYLRQVTVLKNGDEVALLPPISGG